MVILKNFGHEFPPVTEAAQEPNGLLAMGGTLSVERLIAAYQQGIFPWYEAGEPILWWSPNPRAVIFPTQLKISKSLLKQFKKKDYQITFNKAFNKVINQCAMMRSNDTWITNDMIEAYQRLHALGVAESIEVWQSQALVGGIYGVKIGRVFSGESMFSIMPNASKIALVHLAQALGENMLIDCQIMSPHLESLGATKMPRTEFLQFLQGVSANI